MVNPLHTITSTAARASGHNSQLSQSSQSGNHSVNIPCRASSAPASHTMPAEKTATLISSGTIARPDRTGHSDNRD